MTELIESKVEKVLSHSVSSIVVTFERLAKKKLFYVFFTHQSRKCYIKNSTSNITENILMLMLM